MTLKSGLSLVMKVSSSSLSSVIDGGGRAMATPTIPRRFWSWVPFPVGPLGQEFGSRVLSEACGRSAPSICTT